MTCRPVLSELLMGEVVPFLKVDSLTKDSLEGRGRGHGSMR